MEAWEIPEDGALVDVAAVFETSNNVRPIGFWTPGDKLICVEKVMEQRNAATFKDKGIGERYKIQAMGAVSYLFRIGDLWYMGLTAGDMSIPGIHTKYDGNYYGGKKIIDSRYNNPVKVPVTVAAIFYAIGDVEPFAFKWEDGKRYLIDKITARERAVSERAGIIGLRYTIRVTKGEKQRDTYLYRDDDLWFMERRKKDHCRVLDVHGRPIKESMGR